MQLLLLILVLLFRPIFSFLRFQLPFLQQVIQLILQLPQLLIVLLMQQHLPIIFKQQPLQQLLRLIFHEFLLHLPIVRDALIQLYQLISIFQQLLIFLLILQQLFVFQVLQLTYPIHLIQPQLQLILFLLILSLSSFFLRFLFIIILNPVISLTYTGLHFQKLFWSYHLLPVLGCKCQIKHHNASLEFCLTKLLVPNQFR